MKAYKIHLIRHAMTEENLDGKYIGQTDVPASEYGLRQIKDIIDEYGGYPEVDAVVSSPLKRCTEIAKLIYPDKEPMILNGLIEYDFGEFEGRTADEMKDDDAFKTWLSGEHPETPVPFGESQAAFNERVCSCFAGLIDGIIKAGVESTAVITHGGVIMSLMTAFAIPSLPMHEWMAPNGTGYTLRIDPSVWSRGQKLETFSECPAAALSDDQERELWDFYPTERDDEYDITDDVYGDNPDEDEDFWKGL